MIANRHVPTPHFLHVHRIDFVPHSDPHYSADYDLAKSSAIPDPNCFLDCAKPKYYTDPSEVQAQGYSVDFGPCARRINSDGYCDGYKLLGMCCLSEPDGFLPSPQVGRRGCSGLNRMAKRLGIPHGFDCPFQSEKCRMEKRFWIQGCFSQLVHIFHGQRDSLRLLLEKWNGVYWESTTCSGVFASVS